MLVSKSSLKNPREILFRPPAPPAPSYNPSHRNLHTIQVVIASQVSSNKNLNKERKNAIWELREAAGTIVKKPLCSVKGKESESVYVNPAGARILNEVKEIKTDFVKKCQKMEAKTKDLSIELANQKVMAEEQLHSMKLLKDMGTVIRCHFWDNHRKLIGREPGPTTSAIIAGNLAAHTGDIVTDYSLLQEGAISDTETFKLLYGIPHEKVSSYSSLSPLLL